MTILKRQIKRPKEIRNLINKFKNDKKSNQFGRFASFDYCYNYFYSFRKKPKKLAYKRNIEKSCLHLAFFLASWGIYRGSTAPLQKSIKLYEPLIKALAKNKSKIYWKIDADKYTVKNIKRLQDCAIIIKSELGKNLEKPPSDTLVTKIMLGMFGNVPAFDDNFRRGMGRKNLGYPIGKFKDGTLSEKSLQNISGFYEAYKNEVFDKKIICTHEFMIGTHKKVKYTKAKLIDMAGWEMGLAK